MKNLLFFLCILSAAISYAQIKVPIDTIRKQYSEAMRNVNSIYKCGTDPETNVYIQPLALDTGLLNIFSTVIINDDNLVKNGTAASITQDKDKSTISFNYSFITKKLLNIWNLGLYGSSSGSLAQFYSGNNWQKGVGLTIGYSAIGRNNSRSYDPVDCPKLMANRNIYYNQLTAHYNELIDSYQQLVKDSVDNKKIIETTYSPTGETHYTEKQYSDATSKYADAILKLAKYRSNISDIANNQSLTDDDKIKKYESIVRTDFVNFDLKYNKLKGYHINWFAADLNFGVGSNKLYNDTLKTSDSLLHFKTEDYIRAKLNLSYNLSSFQKHYLYYLSFSIGIANTNFLENKKISEIPYLKYDPTLKKIVVKDNEGQNLGSLEELKKTVVAINPGIYCAVFFGENKVIGVEWNNTYKFFSNKPSDIEMKNTVTSTIGILLRVNKTEAISKATIGLTAGIFDGEEDTHVWEKSFGAQLKIGVPFRVLFK